MAGANQALNRVVGGAVVSTTEAKALQLRLRDRLVRSVPPGFAPRTVGGADLSASRRSRRGFAGIVVLDLETLEVVEEAAAESALEFPYVPGLLSFRELPPLEVAWSRLRRRPDVLIFDGQGLAHPRRFGIACHGGLHFDVPSIGCAKSILVGTHGPLAPERGAVAELRDGGEAIGAAVRTRAGVRPVYVSIGHRMDLETATELVLRVSPRFREPETTRQAHRLVNRLRREAEADTAPGGTSAGV